jgi:hypothetical protein
MILAADGRTLLGLFQDIAPRTVELLTSCLAAAEEPADELEALYEALPGCDFSRDVLERAAERLAVVPTRPCGWTDIGTPDRLSRVLDRQPESACVA